MPRQPNPGISVPLLKSLVAKRERVSVLLLMDVAGFSSSLSYAKVRDFAYHDRHPLHYGVRVLEAEDLSPQDTADQEVIDLNSNPYSQGGEEAGLERGNRQSRDDIYRRAVALFDFEPENSNEAKLVEGQVVWISYRHGQGWLVSENLETGETGLVPEEYVQVLPENDEEWVDTN